MRSYHAIEVECRRAFASGLGLPTTSASSNSMQDGTSSSARRRPSGMGLRLAMVIRSSARSPMKTRFWVNSRSYVTSSSETLFQRRAAPVTSKPITANPMTIPSPANMPMAIRTTNKIIQDSCHIWPSIRLSSLCLCSTLSALSGRRCRLVSRAGCARRFGRAGGRWTPR